MATFVYSPQIIVKVATKHGVLDISEDIVGGTLTLRTNALHTFFFELQNAQRRYDLVFEPMDRIIVSMSRIGKPMRIFSGYLNNAPIFSAWPRVLQMQASCTLKRLQFWYWDPTSQATHDLISKWYPQHNSGNQPQQPQPAPPPPGQPPPPPAPPPQPGQVPDQPTVDPGDIDTALGDLTRLLLKDVVGWPEEKVHIGKIPSKWFDLAKDIFAEIYTAINIDKLIGDFNKHLGGQAGGASGGAVGGQLKPGNYGGVDLNEEQARNASTIVNVAANRGLPSQAAIIALMAAKVESDLINVNHGDRDSLGLFQMRPSMGWGTAQQVTDPIYASNKFYDVLTKEVPGWEHMPPGDAAQAVERSGFPGKYAQWEGMARAIVEAIGKGGAGAPASSGVPAGAPQPGGPLAAASGQAGQPAPPPGAPPPAGGGAAPQLPAFPGGETFGFMEEQVKKIFPDMHIISWKRPGDSGYHGAGQALDVVLGPNNERAVELAEGLFKAFPNATQIISQQWRGGLGRLDPSGKGAPAGQAQDHMYTQDNPDHVDHVHWAMKPDPAAWAGANVTPGGAPAAGGGGGEAEAIFNALINIYSWGWEPNTSGNMWPGARAMMNDSPLLPYIANVMGSSLRAWCSAPNGDFMAWFPDYFGIWETAGILTVQPVELMDFTVDWYDQQIVTHQYVVGVHNSMFSQATGQVSGGSQGMDNMVWQATTKGVATMEFKSIFKAILGYEVSQEFVDHYLARFGGRPQVETMPMIYRGPEGQAEFFMALYLFMQRWADQFHAEVPMTFMPELWPGMLIQIPAYNFQCYVKTVKHEFRYGKGGYFRTKAETSAPARLDDKASIFGLLPKAGPRDQDDKQKLRPATVTAKDAPTVDAKDPRDPNANPQNPQNPQQPPPPPPP